jgi:hypothetical protein
MPSTKKRHSTAARDPRASEVDIKVEDLDRCRDVAAASFPDSLVRLPAASCYLVVNDQVLATGAPPTVPVKLTS